MHRGSGGRSTVTALVAVGLILVAACSSGAKSATPSTARRAGGTLRLAMVGVDREPDPAEVVATDQSQMVLLDLLADGLTSIDPTTQQPVPALATKWAADSAGTTWTFTLADGVMFADGTAMTASSVVASLEHLAARPSSLAGARLDVVVGSREFAAGTADHVVGLAAPDAQTVKITTTTPQADLPALLASPLYGVAKLPEADLADTTVTTGPDTSPARWTVGAGPFRVASRAGDESRPSTLVRSDGSDAQLDEIDLVPVPDAAAGVRAVQAGGADWSPAPAGTPASTSSGSGSASKVITSPLGAEEFFGMNLASPTFANQQFRQAIVRAVDGSKVVAVGLPALVPSGGVVPPGVPGSSADPCGDPCRYGPDQARYLLTQAFPDGQVPLVEVDTSDGVGDVAAADSVRDQLIAVGIPAEVKPLPFDQYQHFVTSGNQQLFRTGWVGLAPSAGAYLDPLFRSTSLDNLTAFNVADVDTGLAAAAAEPDTAKRQDRYAGLQQTILGLSPVVPLGSYVSAVALSNALQGYAPRLDGTFVVEQVTVSGGATTTSR